ncbi:hypothetical protein VTK73DRAFT_9510 [Phialemonium thermophilum]|uniref:Uncharacterized protein n=1 Tax=Phialemonium thermophilum TaxID=223376 RepID=A0ABR3Y511_9PEZI
MSVGKDPVKRAPFVHRTAPSPQIGVEQIALVTQTWGFKQLHWEWGSFVPLFSTTLCTPNSALFDPKMRQTPIFRWFVYRYFESRLFSPHSNHPDLSLRVWTGAGSELQTWTSRRRGSVGRRG